MKGKTLGSRRPGDPGPYKRERGGVAVNINSTRRTLYLIARLLGDVNAVQKGRVGRRVARRLTGRATGRALGRLFR